MNRNLPSKGNDPTQYNKAKNTLKVAKDHRKQVQGEPVRDVIADLLVAYAEADLAQKSRKGGFVFERAGSIRGGKKSDWVLRA